jgi:sugar-specific transcriptional regulator TrmB
MIAGEYIKILAELGLTLTEAKVYISLLGLKIATANRIHYRSNVARQEVYRVLSDLEKKGLIEKIIDRPTKFRAIPANNAISILLKRRTEHSQRLRKKAIKYFRNFEIDCEGTLPHKIDNKVIMLSKSQTHPTSQADKLGKAIDDAQKNVLCSVTLSLFAKIKFKNEHIWKKAVKRKVKFKFIISKGSNGESELNLDSELKNTDCFEVRLAPTVLPVSVLLVDEKEAFCRLGHTGNHPVLWSANPNFVHLIRDYFEMKWNYVNMIES